MPFDSQQLVLRELEAGLDLLERGSQRRSLQRPNGVNLCSNDYLDLAQDPGLRRAIAEAVECAEFLGGTGSRLLSGHFDVWDEIEQEFAEFAGTETSLYFGSGYAANVGLLTSLLEKNDLVFSDELNHASIIDGIRLSGARKVIFAHRDLQYLEDALKQHQSERCRKIIVTETVFSMDGDIADLDAIIALAEKHGAAVIVDEAHATGVQGPEGRGIAFASGHNGHLLGILHTCGKALASAGAFVCGSRTLREHLINHARTFIFSTAMPPYMARQVQAALRLAQGRKDARQKLLSNAANFTSELRRAGWDCSSSQSQIVPVIIGSNEDALGAAEFLQTEGFAVRAIRPPTVAPGKARLRLSLTSAISRRELDRLAGSLYQWRTRKEASAAVGRG